ncbi:hypothetical protein EHS13_25195 [Paenibacillus psychroresistens]|uniref:S-layer protein SbsC C-terminal domain-containing protein n=1 Tax=Paenibacillus psychroresistens TaxID=1778678 RepID=A0A6B8RNP2_9BACL|nr:hypothetical protein [Paenibacillus psychroresistens]QGQ97950.1 hypothetical protein EHS13_25195 [Paenibacillus psychroresistens]
MYLKLTKFLLFSSLVVLTLVGFHIEKAAASVSVTPIVIQAEVQASKLIVLELNEGPYNSFSGLPGDFTLTGVASNPLVSGVTISGTLVRLTLSQSIVATDAPLLSYSHSNSNISNNSYQELEAFGPRSVPFAPVPTALFVGTNRTDQIVLNMTHKMSGYLFVGDDPGVFTISGVTHPVTVTNVQITDYTITLQLSGQLAYEDKNMAIHYAPIASNKVTNGIYTIAEIIHGVTNQLLILPEVSEVMAINSNSTSFFDTGDTIRITFNTPLSNVGDLTSLLAGTSFDPLGFGRVITWSNNDQTVEIIIGTYDSVSPLIQLGQAIDLDYNKIFNSIGDSPDEDLTVTLPATLTELPSNEGITGFSFTDLDPRASLLSGTIHFESSADINLSYSVQVTNAAVENIYQNTVAPEETLNHNIDIYSVPFNSVAGLKIQIRTVDTDRNLIGLPVEFPITDLISTVEPFPSGMSVEITATGGVNVSLGTTSLIVDGVIASGHTLYASIANEAAATIPQIGANLPANYPIIFSGGDIELAAKSGNHVSIVEVDITKQIVGYLDLVLSANEIGTAITSIADITPILNYARNSFTLYFSSGLDTEFDLTEADFKIYAGSLFEVASVEYDETDASRHTILVKLTDAIPLNSPEISLIINGSAYKIVGSFPNMKKVAIPLIFFSHIDLTGNGIIDIMDIVEMIHSSSLQVDLNRDNSFNQADMRILLN